MGALGFVLFCCALMETSIHCSTQLLILIFCLCDGHKMRVFPYPVLQCKYMWCIRCGFKELWVWGRPTDLSKKEVGSYVMSSIKMVNVVNCEWRIEVFVRLIYHLCPPWQLSQQCHLSASTIRLLSCIFMFYSAPGKSIHCRQAATWANNPSRPSTVFHRWAPVCPSNRVHLDLMTQGLRFGIHYSSRSRRIKICMVCHGHLLNQLLNKCWSSSSVV